MSKALLGKTILSIAIAQDKEAIKFTTDYGDVVAKADADCCSHTWIEHIDLPALGFPAKVISQDDLEMGKPELEKDGDYIQFYGYKIVTDKGEIIIDYRNESNGYYGGSLSWPDDGYFYGGVYKQNVSNEKWVELKK